MGVFLILRRFSICTLLTTQKVAICWIITLKILPTPQIWLGDWGRWVWLIKAVSNGNLAAASTHLLPKAVWLAMWLIVLTDLSGLWSILDKWNLIICIYFIATISSNKCWMCTLYCTLLTELVSINWLLSATPSKKKKKTGKRLISQLKREVQKLKVMSQ